MKAPSFNCKVPFDYTSSLRPYLLYSNMSVQVSGTVTENNQL